MGRVPLLHIIFHESENTPFWLIGMANPDSSSFLGNIYWMVVKQLKNRDL